MEGFWHAAIRGLMTLVILRNGTFQSQHCRRRRPIVFMFELQLREQLSCLDKQFPLLLLLLHLFALFVLFKLPVDRVGLVLWGKLAFVHVAVCRHVWPLLEPFDVSLFDSFEVPRLADLLDAIYFCYLEEVLLQRRSLHLLLTVSGPAKTQRLTNRIVHRVFLSSSVRVDRLLLSLRVCRTNHPIIVEVATFGSFGKLFESGNVSIYGYRDEVGVGCRRRLRGLRQSRLRTFKHLRVLQALVNRMILQRKHRLVYWLGKRQVSNIR